MSNQPSLRLTPDALDAASTSTPWTRVAPGPLGLLNAILQYLVDARRSAGAGHGAWALRALDQIHEEAGASHGLTVAHTRSALFELEAFGIVEADETKRATPRWRATDAGVAAIIAASTGGQQ